MKSWKWQDKRSSKAQIHSYTCACIKENHTHLRCQTETETKKTIEQRQWQRHLNTWRFCMCSQRSVGGNCVFGRNNNLVRVKEKEIDSKQLKIACKPKSHVYCPFSASQLTICLWLNATRFFPEAICKLMLLFFLVCYIYGAFCSYLTANENGVKLLLHVSYRRKLLAKSCVLTSGLKVYTYICVTRNIPAILSYKMLCSIRVKYWDCGQMTGALLNLIRNE